MTKSAYDNKKAVRFCTAFLFGAAKAITFELIYKIAQWLFENQNQTVFRLPQITMSQRSQQMLEANYAY